MNHEAAHTVADPPSTVAISVDLRNPGLFFACVGLLELAHRVWGCSSLGWFDGNRFLLYVPEHSEEDVNRQLMAVMREMTFTATDSEDSGSPIEVSMGDLGALRVDWWLKAMHRASLRTWGRGTSFELLRSLHAKGMEAENLVSGFAHTAKMTGRLSVDPRASWTALDAGFSPNDQSFTVATFPLVEFLAGIGLQRNRPVVQRRVWSYTAWKVPLPSPLVPTAAQILLPTEITPYTFELASRGQMTRYFTYSIEGES